VPEAEREGKRGPASSGANRRESRPGTARATDGAPDRATDRATDRITDHAGIDRLTGTILPALIAKLAASHLGELEVREGDWRIRLRRPAAAELKEGRRSTDRPSRSQPGHEGHAHARTAPEGTRPPRVPVMGAGDGSAAATNGTGVPRQAAPRPADQPSRHVATSPAVGVFHPGPRAAAGTRVRAGDNLGTVDVLGVPEEVLAPADGIVATTLVEGGVAVEYGQELVRLELTAPAEARS
jgi:acetyl-CoA carboxylase biotin carboxyl carrier protein